MAQACGVRTGGGMAGGRPADCGSVSASACACAVRFQPGQATCRATAPWAYGWAMESRSRPFGCDGKSALGWGPVRHGGRARTYVRTHVPCPALRARIHTSQRTTHGLDMDTTQHAWTCALASTLPLGGYRREKLAGCCDAQKWVACPLDTPNWVSTAEHAACTLCV